MRILFASMPADGHFNPLTGIAVQLADRGHDVRWYAGPAYGIPEVTRLGRALECAGQQGDTATTVALVDELDELLARVQEKLGA